MDSYWFLIFWLILQFLLGWVFPLLFGFFVTNFCLFHFRWEVLKKTFPYYYVWDIENQLNGLWKVLRRLSFDCSTWDYSWILVCEFCICYVTRRSFVKWIIQLIPFQIKQKQWWFNLKTPCSCCSISLSVTLMASKVKTL